MAGSDAPPATASGPGVPYAEWPAALGDPRWHHFNRSGGGADGKTKTRAEIITNYRRQRPEIHAPPSAKEQLMRVRSELEQATKPPQRCSFQLRCRRGRATKKCHHCVQFDALKLGFYCDACFDASHPPYRLQHAWNPIEDDVDHEQSWMTHLTHHNLEQDARELQLLLAHTQSFLQSHESPPKSPLSRPITTDSLAKMRTPTGQLDFQRLRESVAAITTTVKELIQQIQRELATQPMTRDDAQRKIHAMWRIRKARKQLRELLESVYQSVTDPTTGQMYYINTRTNETQWTKPKGLDHPTPLGANPSKNQQREPRVSRLDTITNAEERRAYAAESIQAMARAHSARTHLRRLISSVYEKIWDPSTQRFYYHNTRTDEVKWHKPRWVSDAELPTPRTRNAREAQEALARKAAKLEALHQRLSVEDAASMVQRAFRRRRGLRLLVEMCRGVYERIFDANVGLFYYHNTRTHEVTWGKPRLLQRHGDDVDVFSPRTRERHLRALVTRPPQKKTWTEQEAATRLQGLFRARCARRDLDGRLAEAYKKVWDPSSERFYYANLKTGEVSWDVPAILKRRQAVDVEEIR